MLSYILNSDMAFLQDAMFSCVQKADALCHTQLPKFYKWSQVSFWPLSFIHHESKSHALFSLVNPHALRGPVVCHRLYV